MNRIILIGNLTRDPETSTTQAGVTVTKFTLAVNRRFGGQNGEKVTDFFDVTAWRQLAENCQKYLSKGRKVAVLGELHKDKYTGRDGAEKTKVYVQADDVEFLSPAQDSAQKEEQKPKRDEVSFEDVQTDDIPF